jgi:hypothetical protein
MKPSNFVKFRICIGACIAPVLFGAMQLRAETASPPPAVMEAPLRDPWIPPAARTPSLAPPTRDAALRGQVEQKLKAGFDAADTAHAGTLTREQAQAAHLGLIVRHFDEIDANGTGAVRFDDVKQFLKRRGAQLD